ncbi:ATP/GTP-binding protein [Streptomyces sp. NBC_01285]|uniref:ATP/GTP-binding protein n=1 Tax=unclassified Streptomyces TaxID=2593676 RepID=UPI002256ACA8|nr:ATP/GTP-binding protein [Streptomyces sp. NBC_01285]MCX4769457.1 ATP/GTP-binding protein [Streptomyces sp. NBC_01285]
MDTEGTHDSRGTRSGRPVPRPAGPPPPVLPPRPRHAPASGSSLGDWLRTPRAAAEPGLWRFGHTPRPDADPDRVPDRALISGAIVSLLAGILIWSLWRNGYVPHSRILLELVTPADWWGLERPRAAQNALIIYNSLVAVLVIYGFGRLGNWNEAFRRYAIAHPQPGRALRTALAGAILVWAFTKADEVLPFYYLALGLTPPSWLFSGTNEQSAAGLETFGTVYHLVGAAAILLPIARAGGWLTLVRELRGGKKADQEPATPGTSPADWPQLRAAGQAAAADRLAADERAGRMNDVDCVRIRRAWVSVKADPSRLGPFTDAVLDHGARACLHPSGERDLPTRAATHDLLTSQVRLGRYADFDPNPAARRGAGAAVDPGSLGSSLLAVGPFGSGKTRHLVRPVVESLALQALAGKAVVVAVCAAGSHLGPDDGYDVVVKPGDPASAYDLDLYGGTDNPDEAAGLLAEALTGDLPEVDAQRAATALAQFIGPYRAAHGHFPAVPVLRELLDGSPTATEDLRARLDTDAHRPYIRELDARARQSRALGDPGLALANRVAVLDRPAFAGFFDTTGETRPFSMRALGHPLRVRIDLPERAHPEASHLITRLLLAQFTSGAAARRDRSLFAFLALDDGTHAVTTESVRAVQRLRNCNAGVMITLRALGDVPENLHTALIGSVGCHMTFSGVTTWDGQLFAQAWGTEWVETTEVAKHTVFANQPLTRAVHALRKLATGKAVTTDAVTVRKVERERWSASALAHRVPAGHAVLSLTTVRGEHAPPLLVDLRS